MKILLASGEVHPYSKTGGLGDMVGALGKALAREGHQVGLVTPLYAGIRERFPAIKPFDWVLNLPLGGRRVTGKVCTLEPLPGLTIYFIDQPEFYLRPGLYQNGGFDYHDNAERFIFLSKAVAHLARHLPWKPELVHIHDWQAALVPLLINHEKSTGGWSNPPRTCLTIHNLAYQGQFPVTKFPVTNLPWNYFKPEGAEFYGQLNCLKAGIFFADAVSTVSPRYAREITTPELGCGLDGLLRRRQSQLSGILNGVDYDEWSTLNNPFLKHAYSVEDLSGKRANKLALQEELGLPVNEKIPLFGSVNRLVDQKGVDIQLAALEEALAGEMQFILLGSGDPRYEQGYRELAHRHPTKVAVRIGHDQGLSHRIEAGSDFFILPSRFEPCGLNQMYSLRYGTVPIVRATGGLDDTVIDLTENAASANGIKFTEFSPAALGKGLRKALALYAEPELHRHYQRNGMAADFSWARTARVYADLYQKILTG